MRQPSVHTMRMYLSAPAAQQCPHSVTSLLRQAVHKHNMHTSGVAETMLGYPDWHSHANQHAAAVFVCHVCVACALLRLPSCREYRQHANPAAQAIQHTQCRSNIPRMVKPSAAFSQDASPATPGRSAQRAIAALSALAMSSASRPCCCRSRRRSLYMSQRQDAGCCSCLIRHAPAHMLEPWHACKELLGRAHPDQIAPPVLP